MSNELFTEQEEYELNGYDESAIENEYYDVDGEESTEDVFDDDNLDFLDEESEMDEARRRDHRRRPRRRPRSVGFIRGLRPRGYRRPRYVRPKPKKYYKPIVPSRPANTKNVVKAFGAASNDIEKTKAAVRKVDVDNKIQEHKIKKAFSSQGKRISGNEYALAATNVLKQWGDAFPEHAKHPVVNAIFTAAPTFFQKPIKKEFYKDPRIVTSILTAGILVAKELRDRKKESNSVENITLSPPVKTMDKSSTFAFSAMARDSQGNKIDGKKFRWYADDDSKVSIDSDGKITGKMVGKVVIFAEEIDSGKVSSTQLKIVQSGA